MIAGPKKRRRKAKEFKAFVSAAPAPDAAPSKAVVQQVWKQYVQALKAFAKDLKNGSVPSSTPGPSVPDQPAPGRRLRQRVRKWQGLVGTARQIAANLEAKAAADAAWRASASRGVVSDDPSPATPPADVPPPDAGAPAAPQLPVDGWAPGPGDEYGGVGPDFLDFYRRQTEPPMPEVPPTPESSDDEEEGIPMWAWIAGGAVVLGGLYLASRGRR